MAVGSLNVQTSEDLERLSHMGSDKEKLLALVIDLFDVAAKDCEEHQLALYDDVILKLISCVEMEARLMAANRMAHIERTSRRVTLSLAMEEMPVAEPILRFSQSLSEDDLVHVISEKGEGHLEAIAHREQVSARISDELLRRGSKRVCEVLSANNGAAFSNNGLRHLVRTARSNEKVQHSLCQRVDLPPSMLKKIVLEAGEVIRDQLRSIGRRDLIVHLDHARAEASKRVLSTSSVLGLEYDTAFREMLQYERHATIEIDYFKNALDAANFPLAVCAFSRLAEMELDDAAHWLSRRDVSPAMVACRAIGLPREVVQLLLKSGPWKHVLTADVRKRALGAFDELQKDVAQRIFHSRRDGFSTPKQRQLA